MTNKKYHTVGTVPKSSIEIVERDTIKNPNTQIHSSWHSWFGTGTSIKKKWRAYISFIGPNSFYYRRCWKDHSPGKIAKPNFRINTRTFLRTPITCLYSMSLYVCDCIGLRKYMWSTALYPIKYLNLKLDTGIY